MARCFIINWYASPLWLSGMIQGNLLKTFLKQANISKLSAVHPVRPRIFFFYLGFLSRPFTIHRTAGEVEGYFFNSSLSLSMAFHRHLDISRTITAERSPLLINKNWAPLSQASWGWEKSVLNHGDFMK